MQALWTETHEFRTEYEGYLKVEKKKKEIVRKS